MEFWNRKGSRSPAQVISSVGLSSIRGVPESNGARNGVVIRQDGMGWGGERREQWTEDTEAQRGGIDERFYVG